MSKKRRDFIKQCTVYSGMALLGGRFLISCDKDGYTEIIIDPEKCTACGDCLEVCNYSAILLNNKALYSINADKCTLCSACKSDCYANAIVIPGKHYSISQEKCTFCEKCEQICPEKAITIEPGQVASSAYSISSSDCIGCGYCIDKCKNEGNAISYVVEDYSVNTDVCRGCVGRCSSYCYYGAISSVNQKAYIDMSKCQKCGNCLNGCKQGAINKAYVSINEEKCTNCGKCYAACDKNAVIKSQPESSTDKLAKIDELKCTQCGACYKACNADAILVEEEADSKPYIDQKLCTSCGNCLQTCNKANAIEVQIEPASIIQKNCVLCEKCVSVCQFSAIDKID